MSRIPASRRDADTEQRQLAKKLEDAFALYQDELLGMLYYLLGNVEDARDAVQEAFIKCWKHREEVPDIENLRAWIFRIAMNAGRDMRNTAWRRHRRPLENGETLLVANDAKPEVEAQQRERLAVLRQTIRQLRGEEQEVFLLRQNGQMTYQQIAESISIPLGTVKTRMRLALAKLREALEGK